MNLKPLVFALMGSFAAAPALAQQPETVILKPAKHIDSLWNGALIGAGAGAAGAWIFTRANCGPRGYDNECSAIAGLASTILFIPTGAVAGAVIDRLINKTLPPSATAHTAIAPLVSREGGRTSAGVAVRLQVRF